MLSGLAKRSLLNTKSSILYRCLTTSSILGSNHATQTVTQGQRRFPHDAPERDFDKYPNPRVPIEGGKVRIGLVPDDWFKAMYEKTGVTGPYILFWGGIATLLSKEYFIYWADTAEQMVFLGLVVYISKKYGKTLGSWLDKQAEDANGAITKELEDKTNIIDQTIQKNEALQSLPDANKIIHAAKRENIQLQLEAAFRQRLQQLYQEVRRRLDYQLAIQSVYKRLEKEQAINYILGQVGNSIGPNQEKEAFQSGLSQLKSLSQKYAGTI